MRIALDTNILIYAEGVNGPERQESAGRIVERLRSSILLPLQVCGELHHALVRKAGLSAQDAAHRVAEWIERSETAATSRANFDDAFRLAGAHRFQIWDALIVSVASEADCRLLLSENMQHGFVHRGLTIANPFLADPHPLLADALKGP